MDLDELRRILNRSSADLWDFIDAAITLASSDHPGELRDRRDGIVEKLYTMPNRTVEVDPTSPPTPQSMHRDDDVEAEEEEGEEGGEGDPFGGLFDDDDEETKILKIRDSLEEPDQSEDSLVNLLQTLADMDITFKALKETDIGRHVNRLRKHPSNEVRRLVKQLVRKWKDLVDEWVKVNTPDEHIASNLIGDGYSPQQLRRNAQNGNHQVPDFAHSPNPHNGNNSESEPKPKPKVVPRRDIAARPPPSAHASASAPPKMQRQQMDSNIDLDRLASARKRLQENYQEAQNARKQRTIQVMDIHEIPKPKNGFVARNRGGPLGRHR